MAKNDQVLLDSIIQQRRSAHGQGRSLGEVFEVLAFEQILKDFDFSQDDIEEGWVDGEDDGGIDGFYTIVNGRLAQRIIPGTLPKQSVCVDVYLITAKHHATFVLPPLTNLVATITELLDLTIDRADLVSKYSDALMEARGDLHRAFRAVASSNPVLRFHVVYASRGDAHKIAATVTSQMERVCSALKGNFSKCEVTTMFVGSAELLDMHRKVKKYDLTLEFEEHLTQKSQSYVLLCKLGAYGRFLTDETGKLRRYLFDSNVRDFLGHNAVNDDIRRSLQDGKDYQFWWLNNGITMLATGGNVIGKEIRLTNVQIVNGLQTSETVFDHFISGSNASSEKSVLVRVVISSDVLSPG